MRACKMHEENRRKNRVAMERAIQEVNMNGMEVEMLCQRVLERESILLK